MDEISSVFNSNDFLDDKIDVGFRKVFELLINRKIRSYATDVIANEIDFIKNYIDLQLYRLTDKVKVHFNCSGNIEEKEITPLLFINLV